MEAFFSLHVRRRGNAQDTTLCSSPELALVITCVVTPPPTGAGGGEEGETRKRHVMSPESREIVTVKVVAWTNFPFLLEERQTQTLALRFI